MIEIRTGLPGHGKTLSAVAEHAARLLRCEKHPEEARPYFTNIKGLSLPHSPIPIEKIITSKEGTETYIPDWAAMPDGSLIDFDEAQDFFPPRSSQSVAPPHVAFLNKHRHRGFDIKFITQNPKLIDGNVRALCGKHKHYRRTFGWGKSIVYEWDGCSDNLSGMKNAVTTVWNHPKNAFQWYKSAELHTKQKFKLPLWFVLPFIGLGLAIFFVPKAADVLISGTSGKGIPGTAAAARKDAAAAPAPVGKGGALAPTAAIVPGAPVAPVPAPQIVTVKYSGCIASATKCKCLSEEGVLIDAPEMCRESSESFGHLVKVSLVPGVAKINVTNHEKRLD